MPQIFRIGAYVIYFWSNENEPLEPIHVHVAEVRPNEKGTKVWILKSGKCLLGNNNSDIPQKKLKEIMRMIEANSEDIKEKWLDYFGEIRYFC